MFSKEVISAHRSAALSLLFVCATTLLYGTSAESPSQSRKGVDKEVGIRIAPLPEELYFAGEKVPLEYKYVREAIEREVLTTSCMHTGTTLALRNTTRYFPIIVPILKANNIPEDFKYLCMAESGLNPNVMSHAKACGLWQFLASAAKDYGVETGKNVDLRYNIEIATQAACDYLNEAYEQFGSWSLAAASYNAGRNGVARRLETQGVEEYWDLFLPEETMRYLPRILSFKIIVPEPNEYGFDLKKVDYFPTFKNYTEVEIAEKDIEWSKFAAQHDTNYRQLRILNPWIRSYEYENKEGKSYTVKVPNEKFKRLGY